MYNNCFKGLKKLNRKGKYVELQDNDDKKNTREIRNYKEDEEEIFPGVINHETHPVSSMDSAQIFIFLYRPSRFHITDIIGHSIHSTIQIISTPIFCQLTLSSLST